MPATCCVLCVACLPVLKQQPAGADPAYLNGAAYLKTIGVTNQAEVARVLDIAMNPDSLFLSYGDGRRTKNASVSAPTIVCRPPSPVCMPAFRSWNGLRQASAARRCAGAHHPHEASTGAV